MLKTLAALSAAVSIPTEAEVIKTDLFIHDAKGALKDKGLDQFKMHLLTVLNAEDPAQHFANYEERYKRETKEKAMPAHYRSNKSVLLSCDKYGIPVLDVAGLPRGKTELEKAIKEAKIGDSPLTKAMKAIEKASGIANDELSDAEVVVLVTELARLFPQVVVVSK